MEVTNIKSKAAALAAMRDNEATIAARIDKMVANGELSVDEGGNVSGCGRMCNLFSWHRPKRSPAPARVQGSIEAAVFGKRGKSVSANDRLNQAAESVSAHAVQLADRASAARERARSLAASGKRAEALMSLRRAKALDKQAENATATHAAIEAQRDLLDGQELQREIASALAASVASTKTKSKGLLAKTEIAVDDMEEMRDAFDEVGQVLGGLQNGNDVDDDELAAELDEMIASGEDGSVPMQSAAMDANGGAIGASGASGASVAENAAGAAAAAADLEAAAEVESSFPAVPKKRKEEKLGLLVNDSAAL